MRAVCDDAATLQHMLDFEAALARAEAATGVIPARARSSRSRKPARPKRSTSPGWPKPRPVPAISRSPWSRRSPRKSPGRCGGRALCALGRDQPGRDRHRHHAQPARRDRRAARRSRSRHRRLCRCSRASIATRPMVARTWLQHALPMPFGLKLAEYAAALHRSQAAAAAAARETLALQFGGAAGTLAALGDKGLAVAEATRAANSKLPLPEAPWHTHRDRIAEAASVLAIITGTCGKIARDVSLMMQTDVGEAFEPAGEGRGGSSTMPHKRNPVAAASALGRRHHGAESRRDDLCRPGAGSRAQRRPLACGMADLADAAAGHLGRARRDRRHRRGAGSRCGAHARQSRCHPRADHGGGGERLRWRKRSARATRIILSRPPARRRSPRKNICATC